MRVEVWVSSPEPAVGLFTTAGTCQGRLRRHFVIGSAAPLTEPDCRQVRQLSGSGEGPGTGQAPARLPETGREMATRTRASRCHQPGDRGNGEQDQPLTATVTATAAVNRCHQRPATAHNSRTIRANWGYGRPEKRKVVRRRRPTENLAYALPARAPERPSTANDSHLLPPANMKLARACDLLATHANTLVMRRSLDRDEDQARRRLPSFAAAADEPARPGQRRNSRSLSEYRPTHVRAS
jgi:hypothetical protein